MKKRTYTEDEVAALLERAAELQAQVARRKDHAPGLTLSELETIATEAGLDPTLLRQAAAELEEPGPTLFDASTGTTATQIIEERWVPGPLTQDAWEEIVVELRQRFDTSTGASMGMPMYGVSTTEQIGRTVEWKHLSMSGVETRVMIRPRGNGVRIRASQRVGWGSPMAESFTYGGFLAAFTAGIIGMATTSVAIGIAAFLGLALALVPLILVLDRAWRQKKHRQLDALADRLAELAHTARQHDEEVDDVHDGSMLDTGRPTLLFDEELTEPDPTAARQRTRA